MSLDLLCTLAVLRHVTSLGNKTWWQTFNLVFGLHIGDEFRTLTQVSEHYCHQQTMHDSLNVKLSQVSVVPGEKQGRFASRI